MSESLRVRATKSALWKAFERGGNQAVTLVIQIVLARILAPSDFGAVAIVMVFVNIGMVFVQSGLNTSLIQATEVDSMDLSTVFVLSFGIAVLLYVLVFIFAPIVESFYSMSDLGLALRVGALILPVGAINSVQVAIATRELRMDKLFIATMLSSVTSGAVGIVMAVFGFGIWALVCQQLCMQVTSCLVLVFLVPWRPSLHFDKDKAARHYSFGWKLLVSSLINAAYVNLHDLVIGRMFNASQLGFFNQGRKIPLAVGGVFEATAQSVVLSSAAKVQDDPRRLMEITKRAMQLTTYAVFPCMAILAIAAAPLISLVLTDKWLPSAPFLQVFAVGCALGPISTCNLQALNAMGRSDIVLKLEIVKKSVAVAILLFAAFAFNDMMAIAIGNLVYSVYAIVVNMGPLSRLLGYTRLRQIRDMLPSAILTLVAAAMSAACAFLLSSPALPLLQITVFVVAYLSLSVVFRIEAASYFAATLRELLGNAGRAA